MYTYGITGSSINEFQDVTITGVLDDQILQYNTATGQWENVTVSLGGANALNDLSDVTAPAPSTGDFLKWNGSAWVNDDIDLGTDTTGNYVADVTSGTGITVTHTPGEGSSAAVALNAALNDLSDTVITSPAEFQTLEYNGTSWVNAFSSVATNVRNVDTVALGTGTAVYLFGATGDKASVKRADNDSDVTSSKVVGLVASPILANEEGVVVTRGYVDGIDLSVGYSPGDILYLGEDGGFTKVKPVAPEHAVFLGVVCRANNNGIVYVATQNGYELEELHNVKIDNTLADNDLLQYDDATSLWKNTALSSLGITLGTDTTGNYVSDVTSGTGITVTHTPSEGSSAAVALDADLTDLGDVTVTSASIGQVLEHNGTSFVNRATRPPALNLQTAVTTRKYTVANSIVTSVPGINVGSCAVVTFKNACTITALSVYLNATYGGATTYDYRLGVYADSNGAPGALLVDGGTVSIATGAVAGFKTITLGSALSVAANTPIWLICAATHGPGAVPTLMNYAGNLQPYSDYGLSAATHTNAACLAYLTGPATALPATFSLASPETQPIGVAVYATITI